MKKTKKNYVPFIAGMVTMILLACLISASLAKEDPPADQPQPQVQVQAGDLRLACGEAGIALFGMERAAPGKKLTAENGAEIPAVLTCTDDKGGVHYYVEAETVGDILDVAIGVAYREDINCVDFGELPALDENGKQQVKRRNGEPIWYTGDVKCDIDYALSINEDTGKKTGFSREMDFTDESGITYPAAGRKTVPEGIRAEKEKIWEEIKKEMPLKPGYGVTYGMFTEVDPAEVDMTSWSGTALKRQTIQCDERTGSIERTFAFTPYLGEYAVITIENTGNEDARVYIQRPHTVGSRLYGLFDTVYVPAGQKLVRAFRIDPERIMENQLTLAANAFSDRDIELTLTAEQYRFGK